MKEAMDVCTIMGTDCQMFYNIDFDSPTLQAGFQPCGKTGFTAAFLIRDITLDSALLRESSRDFVVALNGTCA